MPELPEVQSVVDSLSPRLPGPRVLAVDLRRRDITSLGRFTRKPTDPFDLSNALLGRTIVSITRRAKRIVFALDDRSHFYVHLGMTGQLSLNPPTEKPHTHLVVRFSHPALGTGHPALGSVQAILAFSDPRRFGKVVYIPPGHPTDDDLGPEPLTLSARDLHSLLLTTARPIKSALLDQTLIAGLGNIYVDESLHAANIHPLRPSDSLTPTEAKVLGSRIKSILRRAIKMKGSTLRDYRDANGDKGGFQARHRVYDRAGQPCRTCRTPISRIVLTGRSTHFCAYCQMQSP